MPQCDSDPWKSDQGLMKDIHKEFDQKSIQAFGGHHQVSSKDCCTIPLRPSRGPAFAWSGLLPGVLQLFRKQRSTCDDARFWRVTTDARRPHDLKVIEAALQRSVPVLLFATHCSFCIAL